MATIDLMGVHDDHESLESSVHYQPMEDLMRWFAHHLKWRVCTLHLLRVCTLGTLEISWVQAWGGGTKEMACARGRAHLN